MSLEEFIAQDYAEGSIAGHVRTIAQFKAELGENVDQAGYSDVLEYIGRLRERISAKTGRKLKPKGLVMHLLSIKIYYRWLVAVGHRHDHPCESLVLKDQYNRSIEIESLYSMESLEELYKTYRSPKDRRVWATKSEAMLIRDKIIVGLLIYQAMMSSEIIELRLDNIDLVEGIIHIRELDYPGRRANKPRDLSLKSKQILPMLDYLNKYRKELAKNQKPSKRTDHFILSDKGMKLQASHLNRMLKEVPFSPLKIRQSVIAHKLKSGHNLRVVQEFAGHRLSASTEAYKQTGLEELKVNIERLHPHQNDVYTKNI